MILCMYFTPTFPLNTSHKIAFSIFNIYFLLIEIWYNILLFIVNYMVDDTNNQYFESLSDEYNVNTFLSETHITMKSKVFEIL